MPIDSHDQLKSWRTVLLSDEMKVLCIVPELADIEAQLVAHVDTIHAVQDVAQLPEEARGYYDALLLERTLSRVPDAADLLARLTPLLRPGALFLLRDYLTPNHKKSSHYVAGFAQLRDLSLRRVYPQYQWKRLLQDAKIDVQDIAYHEERVDVFDVQLHGAGLIDADKQRLQVMLMRAPERVQQWLLPIDADTRKATFVQYEILIQGWLNDGRDILATDH